MSQETLGVTVFAPAKINLTLHVTGQRDDGYHLLDSLVVFASVGDQLHVKPGQKISVMTKGPEARGVPTDRSNLVLRVARAFTGMPGASFVLHKSLPVASGIGGGSADAAAAFRGLMTCWSDGEVDAKMFDPAHTPMFDKLLALGADIPVCLQSVPKRMRGVGEVLEDTPKMPLLHAVLVNPRVSVSTPVVFEALNNKTNPPMPDVLPSFSGLHGFVSWLGQQRNDLQEPACALVPEIGNLLAVIEGDPNCLLARMSGSGATCFGVFENADMANAAAKRIRKAYPTYWTHAVRLGGFGKASLPRVKRSG